MLSFSDTLYLAVNFQLLLTLFLVALLWALYYWIQRFKFFRWWAWAWTAFAIFLAAASISLRIGPAWTLTKVTLIAALLLSGFAQPFLLVCGGLSWHMPSRPSRRSFWVGAALVVVAAATCLSLGYSYRSTPAISFAFRNVPRAFSMTVALFCCFVVFWRQFRTSRSYAAAITGSFCLAYAFDQSVYFLSFCKILFDHFHGSFPEILTRITSTVFSGQSRLLFLDLVDTCGICLGMILLLVERFRHTAFELQLSERRRRGLAENNASLQSEIEIRDKAEEELRRSEAFSRQVILSSPLAMVVSRGPSEEHILVNDRFTALFGYSDEEVRDVAAWWPRAYPDPQYRAFVGSQWNALVNRATRGETDKLTMEARVRCKDGSFRDIEFHLSLVNDLHLVTFVDLTEHKRAEKELRESEAKFRSVSDLAACAIWIIQDGRIVYLNQSVVNITGYSHEELLAMDAQQLVLPEFRETLRSRADAGRRLTNFQYKIRNKAGEERWLELTDNLISYEGRPAILCSAFDITAAKQAENELQERTLYLESLIANTPLGIVVKGEDRRVLFCNPAFENMFQYKQMDIQGKDLDDLIAPHDREEALRLSNSVHHGGIAQARTQRVRKDGTFLDVELYGVRVYSGDKFVASFVIYQDITERKKSEEKLLALRNRLARAQEEERARIARDLHDDTGQRLALLSIDLEQLKQASIKLKSSLTQQLEALVKAASEITSDVHNVSRRLHPSQVELLGLVPALSNFCRDFSARNEMEIEFYHDSLHQKPPQDASLCLFRVAQEAIRNVQKHSGTRRALVQLDENSGSLRLRVSDHGFGFDPEGSEHLHGLGLLSMQERLHSLGGELFVHSRPGGGTCIEACIPLSSTVPA
jgi:PAS domain S-box-containing protein